MTLFALFWGEGLQLSQTSLRDLWCIKVKNRLKKKIQLAYWKPAEYWALLYFIIKKSINAMEPLKIFTTIPWWHRKYWCHNVNNNTKVLYLLHFFTQFPPQSMHILLPFFNTVLYLSRSPMTFTLSDPATTFLALAFSIVDHWFFFHDKSSLYLPHWLSIPFPFQSTAKCWSMPRSNWVLFSSSSSFSSFSPKWSQPVPRL